MARLTPSIILNMSPVLCLWDTSTATHRVTWLPSSHDLGFLGLHSANAAELSLPPVFNWKSSLISVKLLLNYKSIGEKGSKRWNQTLHVYNSKYVLLKSIAKASLITLRSLLHFE